MNSSVNHEELLELCGKVRDQTLSPEAFKRLQFLLSSDNDAIEVYRQFMSVCSGLEQLGKLNPSSALVNVVIESTSQVGPEIDLTTSVAREKHVESFPAMRRHVASRRMWYVVAACGLASSLMMVLLPFAKFGNQSESHLIATLADTFQAEWSDSNSLKRGTDLKGRYELVSGAITIRYPKGAELLVQAPSIFFIHDADQIDLRTGSLKATVPSSAKGFQVKTPSGTVVDHGTQIGVLVSRQEGLEVHGLEGLSEVRSTGAENGMMLRAGDAAVLKRDGGEPEKIVAEPAYFANSFNELGNLPVVSGDVELRVSPPRSVRRIQSELVDVGRATIFPERRNVTLSRYIRVTFNQPGTPESLLTADVNIPSGTRVDSYVVHFATPRREREGKNVFIADGIFTFPRP